MALQMKHLAYPRLGANVQGVDGDVAAVADHLRHMLVLFLRRATDARNKHFSGIHAARMTYMCRGGNPFQQLAG